MKKIFTLLLLIGLFTNTFSQEIDAKCEFPKEVNAGSDFTMTLIVKKKNLRCYAEFTQKLPAGFVISEKKTSGAEFSYVNGTVKMVWLRLPVDEIVTVTYKIKIDKKLKGPYKINGEFNYIVDNNKGNVKLEEKEINIIAPVKQNQTNQAAKIGCLREKPVFSSDENAVIVTLIINKGNLNSPGLIQESLPKDFKAAAKDCKNATFNIKKIILK